MTKAPKTRVGTVLDENLRARGLSQRALADLLDVSPAYVSGLVLGKKTLSASTADKVAQALNLSSVESGTLHRAAAQDMGFRLDLPDDFDDPA